MKKIQITILCITLLLVFGIGNQNVFGEKFSERIDKTFTCPNHKTTLDIAQKIKCPGILPFTNHFL